MNLCFQFRESKKVVKRKKINNNMKEGQNGQNIQKVAGTLGEEKGYRNQKGRIGLNAKTDNMKPANCSLYLLKKKDCTQFFIFGGAQTFKQLVERSTVFVDRTLFLEELMDGMGARRRSMLFHLPPGVGKTMILTMCKLFFGQMVDERKKLQNYAFFSQFFEHNRQFKIMAKENFVKTHFGRYPTLLLDLAKVSCYVPEIDSVETQIGRQISNLYWEHEYLLEFIEECYQGKSAVLMDLQISKFLNFLKGPIKSINWIYAIEWLTTLLYKYHNEEAIILVDNYDYPIIDVKENFKYSENLHEKEKWLSRVNDFIETFVLAMEQAENVLRLLIFGNDRFQMYSQSHLYNYGFDDQNGPRLPPLLTYFGVSQEEFHELCDCYQFMDVDDRAKATKAVCFYNGNRFNQMQLLNIYSIMMLLNKWLVTGNCEI